MISGGSSACSRLRGRLRRRRAPQPPMSARRRAPHVLDVGPVLGILAGRGLEPAVEDLAQHRLRGRAQAERQDVGVVPGARAASGLGVAAERGAHAGDLVGGDRGAGAGPAADDPLLGAAFGDVACGPLACPGPVGPLAVAERPVRDRLVAALAQLLHHGARQRGVHVACDGDLHRRGEYLGGLRSVSLGAAARCNLGADPQRTRPASATSATTASRRSPGC